jgi:caspase domain-containing protein
MDGKRSALILASYDYEDPGLQLLRAPARDAEALARVLQDPEIGGFEVRTVLNQPAHMANLAVEEFFAERRPDDLLVLHFSGHGVKDDSGELYFATADTKLRRLGSTTVSAGFVNRQMSRSRSRRVVLLLDCCYAGAFERGMAPKADQAVHVEDQFGGRGRAVITASGAMEYAFEDAELTATSELRPSVFTRAVVEGLESGDADRDQDGFVGLDELYDYIFDRVHEVTPNQTPGKWTFGIQGELHIARRRGSATKPVALPEGLRQALDQPLVGIRLGAVQELERLLGARHAGLALAARQTLERLRDDDSRAVAAAAAAALDPQPPPAAPTAEPPAPPAKPPAPPMAPPPAREPMASATEPVTAKPEPARPAVDPEPALPVVDPGSATSRPAGQAAVAERPARRRIAPPGRPRLALLLAMAFALAAVAVGVTYGRDGAKSPAATTAATGPSPSTRDPTQTTRPPSTTNLAVGGQSWKGTKIFEDRFSDKKADWETVDNATHTLGYSNGAYEITAKQAGDHVAFPRPDPELSSPNDVMIGVRARRLAGTSGNGYGITFRYTDSRNYYWFNITNKGARSLNKRMNGKWIRLVWPKDTDGIMSPTGPNHIQVLCTKASGGSARLVMWVNGNQLVDYTDDDPLPPGGRVGLFGYNAGEGPSRWTYDDFSVWALRG